eukprot:gene26518-57199_t
MSDARSFTPGSGEHHTPAAGPAHATEEAIGVRPTPEVGPGPCTASAGERRAKETREWGQGIGAGGAPASR